MIDSNIRKNTLKIDSELKNLVNICINDITPSHGFDSRIGSVTVPTDAFNSLEKYSEKEH